MMQQNRGPAPIGIVYNTSMSRPDAALALGALHVLASRRESRIGSVCVTGAGLEAAMFCDLVATFYVAGSRLPNSNQALPVGLAAVLPMPPASVMVKAVVERKRENGEPVFARSVRRLSDTALAEAVLRNGVSFNATTAVVLSAPATSLAKALDLPGTREVYKQRITRLVIVESDETWKDPRALEKIFAEWPSPIVLAGRDVGTALPVSGATVDAMFGWAAEHPVAQAYRAFQPMPYDAPSHDIAAVHHAVYPSSGFFTAAEVSSASIGGGAVAVKPGAVTRLVVNPETRDEAMAALLEISAAKPAPPQGRRGGGE